MHRGGSEEMSFTLFLIPFLSKQDELVPTAAVEGAHAYSLSCRARSKSRLLI